MTPTSPSADALLPQDQRDAILAEVQVALPRLFGDNLLFGFVCGGVARGYATHDHDIDVFVCLRRPADDATQEAYHRWYFDLHRRHGLPPDYDYPGEVVPLDRLETTLRRLDGWKLVRTVTSVDLKKAIIWTDMMTGGIAGRTGPAQDVLDRLIAERRGEPSRWKEELLRLIPAEEVPSWRDRNHTLLMERFMSYPKHDGKRLQARFGPEATGRETSRQDAVGQEQAPTGE